MEESGMAEEMLAMGDGTSMDDLQASFESFFKASMGFGDGPVTMPDGTTIDASQVRARSRAPEPQLWLGRWDDDRRVTGADDGGDGDDRHGRRRHGP
eukprot:6007737-Prymnesium_polylepis.1